MTPSLETWTTLAQRGDTAAYGHLVRATQQMVQALALARTGNAAVSEEIAQDVFLEAWSKLGQLRNPASFLSWVRQIARHRSTDRARVLRHHDPLEDAIVAGGPDPEGMAEDRDRHARLWRALEALDTDDREVLVLYYLEERSTSQVAELLGIGEAAVRKRLSRARARLRDQDEVEARVRHAALPATFFAALEGRLGPQARAGFRWRIPVAATLALGLLATLGFVAWDDDPAPTLDSPRPAQTRAGLAWLEQLSASKPAPLPPEILAEQEAAGLEVTVRLGSFENARGFTGMIALLDPSVAFPADDEVTWPEGDDIDLVLELVAEGDDRIAQLTPEELTLLEGLATAPPDDPWGSVAALEAARVSATYRWMVAMTAHEVGPMPVSDMSAVHAGVDRILARWPDTAVADFAWLYGLAATEAETPPRTDQRPVVDAALDVLDHTDDALLWEQAAPLLGNAGTTTALSGGELDELFAATRELERVFSRLHLSRMGTTSALAMDDLDRATRWLGVFDTSVEEACAEPGLLCEATVEARDQASSYLAARTDAEPSTWQAALGTVARRCYLRGIALDHPITLTGRYRGGWTLDGDDTEMARCIASAAVPGPAPSEDLEVRLVVLPPR